MDKQSRAEHLESVRSAVEDERARVTQAVEMAFELIGSAARILSTTDYAELAAQIRRGEDLAWFTHPTLMLYHDRNDLARKLRLLDAAAKFRAEFEAVGAEVRALRDEGVSDD